MATRRIFDRKALTARGIKTCNGHLLRLEAADKFPRRIRVTEARVGWFEDEIDAWMAERAAERGPGPEPAPFRRARDAGAEPEVA